MSLDNGWWGRMGADRDVEDVQSLLRRRLRPPRFAVDGIVPAAGVTVLAGRPKQGKSWLALDFALGVGTGTSVLGDVACAAGPVLYLALEDSPYRMRGRVDALLGDADPPDDMLVAYRWTSGLDGLADWAGGHPGGLVVVDVLARFVTLGHSYQAQYGMLGTLNDLARHTGVAVLVVTHTTKTRPGRDPLAAVVGSTAITAAVDTILLLEKEPAPDPRFEVESGPAPVATPTGGQLHVDGKDVDNAVWVLERDGPRWVRRSSGIPVVETVTKVEYQILDVLGDARDHGHDSLLRRDILAQLPGIPEVTIGRLLRVLVEMNLITRVHRGRYRLSNIGFSDG